MDDEGDETPATEREVGDGQEDDTPQTSHWDKNIGYDPWKLKEVGYWK